MAQVLAKRDERRHANQTPYNYVQGTELTAKSCNRPYCHQ